MEVKELEGLPTAAAPAAAGVPEAGIGAAAAAAPAAAGVPKLAGPLVISLERGDDVLVQRLAGLRVQVEAAAPF